MRKNNRAVTNDDMFALSHEKINILFLFWAFFFLFYDFNLNTQGFVNLEIV